ncbi:diaminopimelate epimerase [Bacillus massilinigeriensis]|uniref:diaminopimelate epimerase n=1 Tax=Bacillus mediterraneensis TaxID=1805474 RepID=UPI0008F86537|nr:diaminopimelate epimerase [Bacillus mediterraneensis]
MKIEIIKCHGSGNDFLLIDETKGNLEIHEIFRGKLAELLCNRKGALGADGVLYILKSDRAEARMRVFNSDGSEASMCGNGLRCAGRYVCEQLGITEALIETMKADLRVHKDEDILEGIPTYSVEISPVSFQLEDLPLVLNKKELIKDKIPELSEQLEFTALAVPNPHLAAMVDQVDLDSDLQWELSEKVNGKNPFFPDGVNVSFIRLLGKNRIFVRTYERGVGFTNACGTAMSAASLVTCLTAGNDFEKSIEVYNPGGMVRCVVHRSGGNYSIDLIGNATYLYKALVDVDISGGSVLLQEKKELKEQERYNKIQEIAERVIAEA